RGRLLGRAGRQHERDRERRERYARRRTVVARRIGMVAETTAGAVAVDRARCADARAAVADGWDVAVAGRARHAVPRTAEARRLCGARSPAAVRVARAGLSAVRAPGTRLGAERARLHADDLRLIRGTTVEEIARQVNVREERQVDERFARLALCGAAGIARDAV